MEPVSYASTSRQRRNAQCVSPSQVCKMERLREQVVQELFDDAVIGEEPFRLLEQDGVAELGQVDTVAPQTSWFAGEVLRGGRVVARAQRSWP